MPNKTDKFCCPNCGATVTWEEILEDCKNGGLGMCMCDFMCKTKDGDVFFPRIYHDYIPKEEYDKRFGECKNAD